MERMLDVISVDNMRKSDAFTIENYIPSLTLMYRAAMGVYKAMPKEGRIAIVCGGGNNGGDGFALACILADNGVASTVVCLSEKLTPDSAYYKQQAEEKKVEICPFVAGVGQLKEAEIIVDCMLGTGFAGEPRSPYREAIEEINASGAFVVSVDINSGMNGDTGLGECIVKSDITVTIGFVKKGLISDNAASYIGRLVVTDIGIRLLYPEERTMPEASIGNENSDAGIIPAPPYLDFNVIESLS